MKEIFIENVVLKALKNLNFYTTLRISHMEWNCLNSFEYQEHTMLKVKCKNLIT